MVPLPRHNVFSSIAVGPRARQWFGALFLSIVLMGGSVFAADFVRCPLADGFDHAVGKPDAHGYYKFRGFSPTGHLGEDWNGNGGGNTDLGDPVYSIGNGIVLHAKDIHVGWGNVVILRHAYREATGKIQFIDSLYGHLNEIKVKVNQIVKRGEIVGTIGTNHGMYEAHLHLEIHKNLYMGPNRNGFAHDYSNYYSPTQFIETHRTLSGSFAKVEVPVNTFAPYGETSKQGTIVGSEVKTTGRGLSIPVYRGSTAPVGSSYNSSTKKSLITPTPPTSAAGATSESEDFWQRVKAKVKNGGLTVPGSTPK